MASRRRSVPPPRDAATADEPLQPFRGSFSSGICFASGHSFWLFRFGSTPTQFGAYVGIWAITPDGDRFLYADPAGVVRVASVYHEFDRTVGAKISWYRPEEDVVELRVEGEDGAAVELRAELGTSAGSRLLNALIALVPRPVLRTTIGANLSNRCLSSLMDTNGLKAVGRTETQEPYRFEADWLRTVETAAATVNGEDLGAPSTPKRPNSFGDVRTPDDPFFIAGDLFLRPPGVSRAKPSRSDPEKQGGYHTNTSI